LSIFTPPEPATRRIPLDALLMFGLFAAALALRLHNLGLQSLWLDEGYTYERAIKPLAETISTTIARHHIPTYFVFMHYWLALGDDEWMLRLPSAVAGALTVSAAYGLGTVLGGRRVGLVTAACVLLSPLQVRYAQEARMYTMITLTATVCLTGLAWLGLHLEQASRPILGTARLRPRQAESSPASPADRSARLAWTAYGLGLIGTLYLHNTGVFLGATSCLAVLPLLVAARGTRWPFVLNFLAANAVVVAVWALYLGTAISQAENVADGFWAPYPNAPAIKGIAIDLYAFAAADSIMLYLLGAIACAGLFALRRVPHMAVALVICALGAPVVDLLVSLHTPMFMPRLMLWATVPASALLALGANSVRHWLAPLAVTLLVAYVSQPSLHKVLETTHKPLWRETAIVIAQRAQPGAVVIAAQRQSEVLMNYYLHRKKLPIADLPVKYVPQHQLRRGLRNLSEIWVVDLPRQARAKQYTAAVERLGGRLTYKRRLAAKIEVQRFELPRKPRRGRT
jgi:uncharacterized membrane protein